MKRYVLLAMLMVPAVSLAQSSLTPRPLYQPDRSAEQAREQARQRGDAVQQSSRERQQRVLEQGTQRQEQLQQRDARRSGTYQRRMDDASQRAAEQLRNSDKDTARRMQRLREKAAGD